MPTKVLAKIEVDLCVCGGGAFWFLSNCLVSAAFHRRLSFSVTMVIRAFLLFLSHQHYRVWERWHGIKRQYHKCLSVVVRRVRFCCSSEAAGPHSFQKKWKRSDRFCPIRAVCCCVACRVWKHFLMAKRKGRKINCQTRLEQVQWIWGICRKHVHANPRDSRQHQTITASQVTQFLATRTRVNCSCVHACQKHKRNDKFTEKVYEPRENLS